MTTAMNPGAADPDRQAATIPAARPPVRVTPAVREEIESVLREGESLSEFVAASVLEAARRRKLRQALTEEAQDDLTDVRC